MLGVLVNLIGIVELQFFCYCFVILFMLQSFKRMLSSGKEKLNENYVFMSMVKLKNIDDSKFW